jgi:hypothetical protein
MQSAMGRMENFLFLMQAICIITIEFKGVIFHLILGYDTMQSCRQNPTFRRNIIPPFSRQKLCLPKHRFHSTELGSILAFSIRCTYVATFFATCLYNQRNFPVYIILTWGLKQLGSPTRTCPPTRLHYVTTQRNTMWVYFSITYTQRNRNMTPCSQVEVQFFVLTAVRASYPTKFITSLCNSTSDYTPPPAIAVCLAFTDTYISVRDTR